MKKSHYDNVEKYFKYVKPPLLISSMSGGIIHFVLNEN